MRIVIEEVVVGTESALKIRAVTSVLETLGIKASIVPCKADSGAGIQPVGTRIMENGARGRVRHARELHPNANLYIGIENGLVHQNDRWFDPTCVFALTSDRRESIAFGAFFPIPDWMAERTLEQKSELGEIIKELAGGGEKDPMLYLSEGSVPREQLLSQAIHCALAPIFFPHRYKE